MTERPREPTLPSRAGLGPYGEVVPRLAATVVLVRPGSDGLEVLLAHRPATMAFAPDVHVFPGGAVDPDDADPALGARSRLSAAEAIRVWGATDPAVALAVPIAALRELFEEAGVLLAETAGRPGAPLDRAAVAAERHALVRGERAFLDVCQRLDLELRTDALVPLSRWVTPPILPRRFDARFFAAGLPDGVEPSIDGTEVVALEWVTPAAALGELADGSLRLWVPTASNLQRLEHARDLAAIRDRLAIGTAGLPDVAEVAPDILRVSGPSAAGVDGLTTQTYLVGGRELVAVDPGDPSEEALLATIEAASAADATIGAIALTSADPDHAGGGEHLREGLELLVHAAPGAGAVLPYPVEALRDGAAVPSGDVRLIAVAAPGPRPDHLAFWVPASRTAIVGDLVGPPPARSIPGPPDAPGWRRSLSRIRALAPERLLPAHGDPILGEVAVGRALDAARSRLG